MSLRARINLLLTFVMLVFACALAALQISDSRNSIREEVEAATKVSAQLLGIVSQLNDQQSPAHLASFLQRLGRVRANDIDLFDRDGKPLYHSPPSTYKAGRDAPAWYSRLVSPKVSEVSLSVPDGTLVIRPHVSRAVLDSWDELRRILWLTGLLLVAVNAPVFWLASRSLRPVKDIVAGLQRMEYMQFHTRLPPFKLRELDVVSETFNRMAQAVEDGFAARERAERSEHQLRQNRELTQIIQDHIEEERRNLARELHDELGQAVTAVRTIATTIVTRAREDNPEVASRAQTIVDVSGQMYTTMHDLVSKLRPLSLDNLGLGDALHDLVGTQTQRHPEIIVSLQLESDLTDLSAELSISAYRIVQECLTNVLRHAEATRANVRVSRAAEPSGECLVLEVSDNGVGKAADVTAREGHYGVLGVRERVSALHGSLTVSDRQPVGVCVAARLPVQTKPKIALT